MEEIDLKEEEVSKQDAGGATAETADTADNPVVYKAAAGKKETSPKLKQFLQVLKFTGFSISAGAIQILSFAILYDWTHWLPWWPAYLISLVLSVLWNFTFNRKFTFRSSANVPLAMCLVLVYYCMFTPVSVFGGDAMTAAIGEDLGIVTTVTMMLINFATEFLWDKFVVFNDRVIGKLESLFKHNKSETAVTDDLSKEGAEPDGEEEE